MRRLLAAALALASLAPGGVLIPHGALAAAAAAALPAAAADAAWEAEAVAKLRAYLQVDTTNPPGHEARAADLVARWLAADGIAFERIETAPGRTAVVARLVATRPDGTKPLLLLHHSDVVPAEPARWKHAPFGGEEADGAIWGRGALDMKGFGVLQYLAFAALKRQGVALRRDVIWAATPDEEAGGHAGVQWLLAHRLDAVDAGEVLNEGGMGLVTKSGKPLMGIQTAERGTLWVRLTARGDTGHGSRERRDSAPRRLVRALAQLETAPRALELGAESQAMLNAFASTESGVAAWALRAAAQPWLLPLIGPKLVAAEPALAPLLANTMNPTVFSGGTKTNVVPGAVSVELDVRVLPGRSTAATLEGLRATAAVPGDPPLEWTVLHATEPSRSAPAGPLWDALVAAVRREYPEAPVMPILTPGGGTDSAYFRARGIQALGCMPIMVTQAQVDAIHGDDEHVTREQLRRGARALTDAVRQAAEAPPP